MLLNRPYYQGIWDYADFPSYLDSWIIPFMLRDLDTVFDGSRQKWIADGCPPTGNGNFILANALLAAMEQIGGFLAKPNEKQSTSENIARLARELPSSKDIDLIIGKLGRNALAHQTWPLTIVEMNGGTWAFSLYITATPDASDHGSLYKTVEITGEESIRTEVPLIRKLLNVFTLKNELSAFIRGETLAGRVSKKTFDKIVHLASFCCQNPFCSSTEFATFKQSLSPPEKAAGKNRAKECVKQVLGQANLFDPEFLLQHVPPKPVRTKAKAKVKKKK